MQKKKTIPASPQTTNPFPSHQPAAQHPPQAIVRHQQHVQTIFDPDVLKKYKEMVPDAPERVLAVFEKNSATERHMTEQSLAAQRADNQRRDWMAFIIILGGMAASAFFAYLGKEWLSGGTLVAIVGYAVIGYLQKSKKHPPKQ